MRLRGHFVLATDIQRPSRGNAGALQADKRNHVPQGMEADDAGNFSEKAGFESRFLDPSIRYDERTGGFCYLDILNGEAVRETIVNHGIDTIVHMSTLLSAVGELNHQRALEVNVQGLHHVLEAGRTLGCAVFAPSSMAAFGPSTPKDAPDETIMRPTTVYGITKVYVELLGEWYRVNKGVDFRSVRYPGVLSAETLPGGGTTDYAVEIFHDALGEKKHHDCFLAADATLPMIHIEDTLNGTIQLIEAPAERLTQSTYNLGAISFAPKEIYEVLRDRHCPELTINYKPDFRQKIAETWPRRLDDSIARRDWGWQHEYDLPELVDSLYSGIRDLYFKE